MVIIGYLFKNVEIKRKKFERVEKIDLNIKMENVENRKIENIGNVLKIDFEMRIDYSPNVLLAKIQGEVLYKTDEAKKIVTKWKKTKKLPENVDLAVKNFIIKKCLTLFIPLSENFQVPPPVPFPILTPKPKKGS